MSQDDKVIPITRGLTPGKHRTCDFHGLSVVVSTERSKEIRLGLTPGTSNERRNTTLPNYFIGQDHKICNADNHDEVPAGALPFSTLDEFKRIVGEFPLSRLVGIWNMLPGVRTISRFENRGIAVDRIWQALAKPDSGLSRNRQQRARRNGRHKRQPKGELILSLLRRPEGATLDEIRKITRWQAHSVRGFISGKVSKA